MKTLKQIHDYWKNPDDGKNNPQGYLDPMARTLFLFMQFISPYLKKNNSILELGCSVGRNLNYLFENGYTNLFGVEVNKKAIEILKKEYSGMKRNTIVINTTIEYFLKIHAGNPFDCIFTMAVLEHIHPDSEWIFRKMVRTCNKYIITIEEEGKVRSWRHFDRNYKTIFESLGMKQIKEINCERIAGLGKTFFARIFEK